VTVTGHEDEFRRLFQQEAATRLAALAEHAMELESRGHDRELVADMFRDAHTLKGGAAVVGFDALAGVVHDLEQLLEELRAGQRQADAVVVDGVLACVDALREMVDRAMAGADAPDAELRARAGLATARGDGDGEAAAVPEPEPEPEAAPPAPPEDPFGPVAAEPGEPRDALPPPPPLGPEPRPIPRAAEHAAAIRAAWEAAQLDEPGAPGDPTPAPADPATPELPGTLGFGAPAPPAAPTQPARPGEAIPVPVERLDELVRLVSESTASLLRIGGLIADRFGDDPEATDEYRDLSRVLQRLQERTLRARMVSVATVAGPLRRAVRDIGRATGKQVRWELVGEATELDRHVLAQLREPLVALVRNAVDHGIEPPQERTGRGKPAEGTVRVHAMQIGADVVIVVGDDGRGVDVGEVQQKAGRRLSEGDALSTIFDPGFSTAKAVTDVSGRGVGLDAVRTAVDSLRGRVEVRSTPGEGAEFRISVPMTLAALRCLLVRAGGHPYAVPMHSTAVALRCGPDDVVTVDGQPGLLMEGEGIGLAPLAGVLGLRRDTAPHGPAIVLTTASGRHAFQVDELLGQRDVVVKEIGGMLPRLPMVAGASVEPDGSVMLVLDPDGLIATARGGVPLPAAPSAAADASPPPGGEPAPAERPRRGRVLVVDDALTIRELQRSILERAGYEVLTAADGGEALRVLAERPADLVLTDIEMPRMDGFALTEAIRDSSELAATPVLILTSRDAEEDRRRGLEAGADGYLVKSAFDEHALLTAVGRLLGATA
jgi:two-component system chemotaxis sensor kinase CheA